MYYSCGNSKKICTKVWVTETKLLKILTENFDRIKLTDLQIQEVVASLRQSYTNEQLFFKNSQKMDCANHISSNFNIEQLIQKTCYITPTGNSVYFDLPSGIINENNSKRFMLFSGWVFSSLVLDMVLDIRYYLQLQSS